MYRLDQTNKKITRVDETSFKALGLKERQDIQEWICSNPEILGEELLIIAKEFDGFADTSERLDLLALDSEGNLVIIENKRDDSGTGVEWQAIKYASYCSTLKKSDVIDIYSEYLGKNDIVGNPENLIDDFFDNNSSIVYPSNKQRIILVAHSFRKEVLSAAQWLLNQQIDIKCVSIKPYKSDNAVYLDPDIILPQEDNKEYTLKIADKQRDNSRETRKASETGKMYRIFWNEFKNYFANQEHTSFKDRDFSNNIDGWIGANASMGSGRMCYDLCSYKKGIRIELYIDSNKGAELNKNIFDYFLTKKENIENKLPGKTIKWDRLDSKIACRISIENNELSFQNRDDWIPIFNYFNDNIIGFEEAFKPFANDIKKMIENYDSDIKE